MKPRFYVLSRSQKSRTIWVVCSLLAVSLSLPWRLEPVQAQQPGGTALPVPAGAELRATLDGRTAIVKVEDVLKIVEFRVGRKEQERFVAYRSDEPMPYDEPFVVQARFSSEPPFHQTTVTLKWENGGRQEVPVYKSNSDPKLFESEEHPFEDPSSCRGLTFCIEGAEENSWTVEP